MVNYSKERSFNVYTKTKKDKSHRYEVKLWVQARLQNRAGNFQAPEFSLFQGRWKIFCRFLLQFRSKHRESVNKSGINFTNIFRPAFLKISVYQIFTNTNFVRTVKLRKTLLDEKNSHKMLVKLTPVTNLTNILWCAFM